LKKRFRLKSDFDISGFSEEVQVILRALKKYGMILAENGSAWYLSGAPDPLWDNDVLVSELSQVNGSDFEAVDESALMVNPDSGQALQSVDPGSTPEQGLDNPGGSGGSNGCFITTSRNHWSNWKLPPKWTVPISFVSSNLKEFLKINR
jgi:hypothetical protein